MDVIHILIRTVGFYILIIFMLRIMGKREVGELGIADLIVLLIVADIAVIAFENLDQPWYLYAASIVTIGLLEMILSFLSLKNNKVRRIIDGKPSIIVYKGKLNIKEMKSQMYNVDDLITQMRNDSIRSVSEIEIAILERSGDLSVFQMKNPAINISPLPLIVSGEIVKENTKLLNIEKHWLQNQIEKQGYKDVSEIYFASLEDDELFIASLIEL